MPLGGGRLAGHIPIMKRSHAFRIAVILAIATVLPAPGQESAGADQLRTRLDTIERRVDRLSRPERPDTALDARLPGLKSQLNRLQAKSLRQEGRQARVNDQRIRELERRLDTLEARDDPARARPSTPPGRPLPFSGPRTRMITPDIPETDLDPDSVFDGG